MPENITYIFLLAIGASFVQRTTGFGFGIFIMTVLPFLMPSYAEAVTLSGILSLTSSAVVMLKYRKYVNWKRLLPILATFFLMSSLAIVMLERIEGRTMRMIQTYAVLTNVIMFAVRAYNGHVTPAVGMTYLYSCGGLAIGVLAGSWAFKRIPNMLFTYVVYAYIGISGMIILCTS